MVVTRCTKLPTVEELTVQEIDVSTPTLRAGAFYMGKYCERYNNEFMLCRKEEKDPRKCLDEGKAVTACSLDFFRKVKSCCFKEFCAFASCLDKSSPNMEFRYCRCTQTALDDCIYRNLGIHRPNWGYFCRARVHDTTRPKPERFWPEFPDPTTGLPEDYPRPSARYGSRWFWMS